MRPSYTLDVATLSRLDFDTLMRLGVDGKPLNPRNDYERHLYARKLRIEGNTREEAAEALAALGLDDVTENQRSQYIEDVLDSVLVGFSNTQPFYEDGG